MQEPDELKKGKLNITSFLPLDDLKRIFPPNYDGVEFKFCGVLGDPSYSFQFADMLEYLLENPA